MKIEMGESLFYSWLRHVKECQIVQTNWKVSQQWEMKHGDEMDEIISELKSYFNLLSAEQNVDYKFFEKSDRSQIIKQGECDVLGINISDGALSYYAVDVAFHEGGLDYGNKYETVTKVIEKCVRTALCIYGYFDTKAADVIFASPKIENSKLVLLTPLMEYINTYFADKGFEFKFRLIYNEGFGTDVIEPIILVSDGVSDTGELFMRANTLLNIFEKVKQQAENNKKKAKKATKKAAKAVIGEAAIALNDDDSFVFSAYKELKVGQIAQKVLWPILESGEVDDKEIADMQTLDYSRDIFHLRFPLLSATNTENRYYAKPLTIKGKKFYLCAQWFEKETNNDRPYLLAWIQKHLDDNK